MYRKVALENIPEVTCTKFSGSFRKLTVGTHFSAVLLLKPETWMLCSSWSIKNKNSWNSHIPPVPLSGLNAVVKFFFFPGLNVWKENHIGVFISLLEQYCWILITKLIYPFFPGNVEYCYQDNMAHVSSVATFCLSSPWWLIVLKQRSKSLT